MNKLLPLLVAPFFVVACASDVEEEESDTSESALKCPSPVEDQKAFMACVKKKAANKSGGSNPSGSSSSKSSSISVSGDGSCSSLSVSCIDGDCTCRGNGGAEKKCSGSDCQSVCCP